MRKMTTQQMVNELHKKLTNPVFNFTDEQVQLIIKLKQSFETDEERTLRLQKFREVVAKTQQSKV